MTPVEIALADELLQQGLQYWTAFQAQKAAGTLTRDDLTKAAAMLNHDIDQLAADIAAQQAPTK